ncbi:alkyl hydroperoxide reductase/ thiol specific antioxidant/ Mal allergen [Natrialba chahannaoensis JCM 10990]|uniref:Alkyl hydroperoxide reductase/ thiol specific antioxidant/ Mal allergen n=1 Tax=Natrialba chahannaoensis JCM 10990 TaxID=1227492 RepID=M0A9N8_9EURY|nr:TlpA disulfide reductase family protein [Natrialba chahannaoensis]ELY95254.1 alkyl hydroperoxide reductase/ thiol specific antioxidant/ Mal allergen [Natrialba chahannaoensis JCM 10990]
MRRRDVLAGVGSAGVLAGAGALAVYGAPSPSALLGEDGERHDPLAIETVEAPGSEAGEVLVPAQEQPTFIDIFGTWCPPCVEQMPELATANERIGDQVLFISVTNESVGENRSITEAELVDWWDEHDGNWLLGLDPAAELTERYLAGGYPTAAVIDATGRVRWADDGVHSADEIVERIEAETEAEETS